MFKDYQNKSNIMVDNQHNIYDDYEIHHEEIVDELQQKTEENNINTYLLIAVVVIGILLLGACFIYL